MTQAARWSDFRRYWLGDSFRGLGGQLVYSSDRTKRPSRFGGNLRGVLGQISDHSLIRRRIRRFPFRGRLGKTFWCRCRCFNCLVGSGCWLNVRGFRRCRSTIFYGLHRRARVLRFSGSALGRRGSSL